MRVASCLIHRLVMVAVLCVAAATVSCLNFGTANAQTPDAFSQNKRLGRGVNVLGYDLIWQDRQKARFQEKYFRLIREAGFDHVRVNLHVFRNIKLGPDNKFSPKWFETLDWTLKHALANRLMVIIDFHEFQAMGEDPVGNKQRMLAVWRQIAEHCKNAPDDVLFEILNEPNKKLTSALWNPLLHEALAIIRQSNPHRTVIVGPTSWNNINDLDKLDLPDEDCNLIATVHYYSPFAFTHQGAPWAGLTSKTGVPWNGSEKEQQAIGKDFDRAQAWAEKHQRPIYLGEFGAYDKAEMSSRTRWANFVARQAEKRSWSWAWWQFDNDFILFDVKKDVWVEPILRALVPAAADATATTDNRTSHCEPQSWPAEKVWQWYKQQPWLCGFNYIPATAINYTEMWQNETFDPKTIDEELALAEQVRFNSLRCVLQYLVWEHDPDGFKRRMDQFLTICHKHGIRVVFCLFDDCVFGPKHDPYLGKQADVVPGWYAHDWSPSPGWSRVKDTKTWPKLQEYVRDVLTRFKDDPRVLIWDLYNEPTNGIGDATLPLLTKVVDWARLVKPSQPLTVGVWSENRQLSDLAISRSDVITFHRYSNALQLEAFIRSLQKHNRPLICTEWLKRNWGSVGDLLPVFVRHRVGCLHWGLVNGKTQTQYRWGSKAGAPEPKIWQHDLFRKDRTPYDPGEIELFKQSIARSQAQNATNCEGEPQVGARDTTRSMRYPPNEAATAWFSKPPADCPFEKSTDLNGIAFTGRHKEYTTADTWYPSWASDGNLYSPFTDGAVNEVRCHSGPRDWVTGNARIEGDDPLNLKIVPLGVHKAPATPYGGRYPCGSLVHNGIWYYGTYCLDWYKYPWDVMGPFVGFRISRDEGRTWEDTPCTPEKPLFGEAIKHLGPHTVVPQKPGPNVFADQFRKMPKVKMGSPHFVDFGKNMEHSHDGKAYLTGHGTTRPEATCSWISGDHVYLARVTPSPENVNDVTKYEFFAGHDAQGQPVWIKDFTKIKPLAEWKNRSGCVTMTYFAALKRYLMCVTDGGRTGNGPYNTWIVESQHITGPWRLVTYLERFGEQAYFVNVPSKFINSDGRTAWLCYSHGWQHQSGNPTGSRYAMNLREFKVLEPSGQ